MRAVGGPGRSGGRGWSPRTRQPGGRAAAGGPGRRRGRCPAPPAPAVGQQAAVQRRLGVRLGRDPSAGTSSAPGSRGPPAGGTGVPAGSKPRRFTTAARRGTGRRPGGPSARPGGLADPGRAADRREPWPGRSPRPVQQLGQRLQLRGAAKCRNGRAAAAAPPPRPPRSPRPPPAAGSAGGAPTARSGASWAAGRPALRRRSRSAVRAGVAGQDLLVYLAQAGPGSRPSSRSSTVRVWRYRASASVCRPLR